MFENTILKRNREGRPARVFAMKNAYPRLVELAARLGFDAISLDGEHGAFTPDLVDSICGIAHGHGLSVVCRVPSIDAYMINLWLDRGIQGVVGPHIETKDEAQRLADACLFPPDGKRSWGGGRGTEFNDIVTIEEKYGSRLEFAKWANQNMIVSAQIESRKAYDNLDEILSVPGLSGIAGGPNDFAASLGFPGQPDHPERQRLTKDAEERARRAGKRAGGDQVVMSIEDLVATQGREFIKRHA